MPAPLFPGFYRMLLVVLGLIVCACGAPWLAQGRTKRRRIVGGCLFFLGMFLICTAVVLGKIGVG
jgi:hypothetical protein